MSWVKLDGRRHSWTSGSWAVVGAFVLAVLIFAGPTRGQRGRGGRGAPNAERAAQEAVEQAGLDVQRIATGILEEVAQNRLLTSADVAIIREELKEANQHKGLLSKEDRTKFMMVEAYLGYYGGEDSDRVLGLINSARRMVRDDPDLNDSAIVLGLCYGDWALVKSILREVGPDPAAVRERYEGGLVVAPRRQMDPNVAATRGFGNGRDEQVVNDTSGGSKWRRDKKDERSMGFGVGHGMGSAAPVDPGFLGSSSHSRPRAPKSRLSKQGKRNGSSRKDTHLKGALNLPVEHMPYEHLGDDFAQMTVRNINGSYFQFVPGQGQLLCALMWELGDDEGPARPAVEESISRGRRGRNPSRGARSAPKSTQSEATNKVSYDLGGNARQFGELFAQGLASGKMQLVGVNTDPGYAAGEVVEYCWTTRRRGRRACWMIQPMVDSGRWVVVSVR